MFRALSSIYSLLENSACQYPEKLCVDDSYRSLTYKELLTRSKALAKGLSHVIKIKKGQAVGVVIINSVTFVEVQFSLLCGGYVVTPLDPEIKYKNLLHAIETADLSVVITDNMKIAKYLASQVSTMSVIYSGKSKLECCYFLDELFDFSGNQYKSIITNSNAIASYMFTTGSTGNPKAVVLSHFNVLSAISNIVEFVGYEHNYHELITLPLSHNFGLGHVYCNIAVGGRVSLLPGLSDFQLLFKTLMEKRPNGFPGTPSGYFILAKRFPKKLQQCGSFLRHIVIDSEPLPPELNIEIRTLLPNTRIIVYYGLTEASRSTFIDYSIDAEMYFCKSVGKATPNVEIKIVDNNMCKNQPFEQGRVVIQGNHIMQGYLNDNKLTSEVIKNKWFYTDDIGYLDENGYLFLTGRKSTFINKGGIKIDPKEIEEAFKKNTDITNVAVVGLSHINFGILIFCVVTLKPNSMLNKNLLKEYCAKSLEKVKMPNEIIILDKIPKSSTGKLLRSELVQEVIRYSKYDDLELIN
jgi:long-chain acyl-CoA synthetase